MDCGTVYGPGEYLADVDGELLEGILEIEDPDGAIVDDVETGDPPAGWCCICGSFDVRLRPLSDE